MASRRFLVQKRGRPPKPKNRPRGPALDHGTDELRAKKLATVRRVDLELSPIDILHGRGLLDQKQRDTLGEVAELLRLLAHHLGPKPDPIQALRAAIVGAAIRSTSGTPSSVGPLADMATWRLRGMLGRLNGSRDLVVALAEDRPVPLVAHVLAGRLDDDDLDALERLRSGLDDIAKGRRRPLYKR